MLTPVLCVWKAEAYLIFGVAQKPPKHYFKNKSCIIFQILINWKNNFLWETTVVYPQTLCIYAYSMQYINHGY